MKMTKRVPEYFGQFDCVGSECADNCCIGWGIDIDEDTYEFYQNVGGEFGDRLRADIEDRSFKLRKNRCAFLNSENLCDIISELGENRLCAVCAEYPRFTERFGDLVETGLGMSCPTAAELIFKSGTEFVTLDADGEADEIDEDFLKSLICAREKIFDILRNESRMVEERIAEVLCYSKAVQDRINENKPFDDVDIQVDFDKFRNKPKLDLERGMYAVFDTLEVMDDNWSVELTSAKACDGELPSENCFYDKIMVYFIFRYFLKAAFDCDVYSKVRLAVVSFLMIRRMDAARQGVAGNFTFSDRVDTAHIYSKEVEHSEDNLDTLYEEFIFNDAFSLESLLVMILN